MPAINAASITAFYLFDVADEIDLARLQKEIGGGAAAARFAPKSGTPSYLQYAIPPLIVDGGAVGIEEIQGFRARLKFFDYGVVSLALTRPFAGDWPELIALSQQFIDNDALERQSESACRAVVERSAVAMTRGRNTNTAAKPLQIRVARFRRCRGDVPEPDGLILPAGDQGLAVR